MTFDAVTIAAFLGAVALQGISKGGLAGVGMMSMPLLLFVMPPATAAGLFLPVLMTQDVFSVWLYRGQWDAANLKLLVPAAAVGIVFGYLMFLTLPEAGLLILLGAITLIFALRGLTRLKAPPTPPRPIWGRILGAISGFTSTVLHVGSPPFQIYLLPQKLPRDVFIGTTVTFFFLMNWMKLPVFIALGQLTGPNLLIALLVAPFALAMTFVGKRLASVIEPERFYLIIHLLLAALGLKLLWDGLSSSAIFAG